jgi:hypothetical protein
MIFNAATEADRLRRLHDFGDRCARTFREAINGGAQQCELDRLYLKLLRGIQSAWRGARVDPGATSELAEFLEYIEHLIRAECSSMQLTEG